MKQSEPFGKYLLLGQVAVGGMAEIYKARYADPSMPQVDIALKRILPSYTEDETFVTMFRDEGNIAIRLKHPNIVNIFEVGEVNNDWYIAMEYIHGTDIRILSDICDKNNKRFTPTQVARIMCETAKALFYAHTCSAEDGTPLNIVHRDCTPHNIMVSQKGEVKLMDFGIAKAASRATKTRVGTVKGKSSYMSPEQAKGKLLDGRSDMFTLGTVAWELLTGYRLFKAATDFDILTKVLKSELIHPSDIDSNVPRQLGDIIMKTLERDRELRYTTCGVLASTLDNWILANGDGSDMNLGNVVLALTNKQGHSISELPDYVPGTSLYNYEDGNFVRKNGAGGGPRMTMPYNAPAELQSSSAAPSMPSAPSPAPAYPPGFTMDGSMAMQMTPKSKVPIIYFILFILLFAATGVFTVMGLSSMSEQSGETENFEALPAYLTIKSTPPDATVKINGEVVKGENGNPARTPIYSYESKLGEKVTLTFEKDTMETVEVERSVALINQNIEVALKTLEEINADKLDNIPEFIIQTDPDGALVKVNGEDKGKSPVTLTEVKFGTELEIEVSVDGSKEYGVAKRVFTAAKGAEKELKITLEKAEKTVAVAAPPAQNTDSAKNSGSSKNTGSAKEATPKTQKTAANTGSSKGTGTINVSSTPWSIVKIDSKPIGNSPRSKDVNAGKHKVELVQPTTKKKASKTVDVKAGKTVELHYDFKSEKWSQK